MRNPSSPKSIIGFPLNEQGKSPNLDKPKAHERNTDDWTADDYPVLASGAELYDLEGAVGPSGLNVGGVYLPAVTHVVQ